jgi:hypothetical protein
MLTPGGINQSEVSGVSCTYFWKRAMPAPGSAPYSRYEPVSSQRRQLDLLQEKTMPAPGSAPYFRYEPISSQRRQLDLLQEKTMPAPGSEPYFRYEPISSQRRQLDLFLEKSDASARVRTLLQV